MAASFFETGRDITGMGTILAVFIPVALKSLPAMGTDGRVKGGFMDKLRVLLPPCAAASLGAKFSLFSLWLLRERLSTVPADQNRLFGSHAGEVIAAAKALDRILGNLQPGGNRSITKPFTAQIAHLFFLCFC